MSQITEYVATGEREERRDEQTKGAELIPPNSAQDLRGEWDRIQGGFVDDPRSSVKQADELVANALKRLTETFTQQRADLEHQWDRGEDVSTEDLRVALQKYRAFFQRLLAV